MPIAVAGAPKTTCSNKSVIIGSDSVAGYNYSWQPTTGLDNPHKANPVVTLSNNTSDVLTFNYIVTVDSAGFAMPAQDSIKVVVNPAPSIQDTISDMTLCLGNAANFTINANGIDLSYQWTKGGTNISGATSSVFSILNVQTGDNDVYSCIVNDSCGADTLSPFHLKVYESPSVNFTFQSQTMYLGDSVNYALSPVGTPPFTYKWYHNGVIMPGDTGNILKILLLDIADSGLYTCSIKNVCDSAITRISHLTVIIPSRLRYEISGIVAYDNLRATPMKNTKVYLYQLTTNNEQLIDSSVTDSTGTYIFENKLNGNYMLICSTSIPWGGATPTDALLVNRAFLGIFRFDDGFLKKAGDVNDDGKLNPLDALLINRRFIGVLKKFTINDWLFTSTNVVVNGDNMIQNIKAVCAGDANASYIPR